MQFSVYLSGPIPDKAPHKVSRTLAEAALHFGKARQVGQNAIQITCGMSIRELKDYLRGGYAIRGGGDPFDSGKLNPPGYHVLPYTYPLPVSILEHYQ